MTALWAACRALIAGAALALLATVAGILVAVTLEPLPQALQEGPPEPGLDILDRHGRRIAMVVAPDGRRASSVTLAEVSPLLTHALISAEDRRFYQHPGVDPIAMLRAVGQALRERRIVSGASTLTQQLARSLMRRPRSLRGKLREIVVALRIERALDKRRILADYLNRVEFGPNLRGAAAASRYYFDKPASDLDLAEAAMLAALVRAPSAYQPDRNPKRLRERRDWVIARMQRLGLVTQDAAQRAAARPIEPQSAWLGGGVEHLVRALVRRDVQPELERSLRRVETTVDLELQRRVEALVGRSSTRLRAFGASAAAALVIDTPTGDVLAYVGSPDFLARDALGQNDGARALRQPGSTLKPFVYAAAMEHLAWTAATLVPDLELHLPTAHGDYSPRNYDGRYHGPVRLRRALASSLNVPAIYAAERVGPPQVLEVLHRFGFASLDRHAAHYGAALALGDGEVRLTELAAAYATLARGGGYRPLRFVRRYQTAVGNERVLPEKPLQRAVDARTAALLSDMLSDDVARAAAFGRDSVLSFPETTAVKTGTSKGFRDNWVIGYTRRVTVAVWVGNFDGTPMLGSSGSTGAGPLFHEVMRAATTAGSVPTAASVRLISADICPLSGMRPGPACPDRTNELFIAGSSPTSVCNMHVHVLVDAANGLLSADGCPGAVKRSFEHYPAKFGSWAEHADRPLAPRAWSPRCPARSQMASNGPLVIAYPFDGAEFLIDPALAVQRQQIVFSARAASDTPSIAWWLDGKPIGTRAPPFSLPWQMAPGRHVLEARSASGERSRSVRFSVR